MNMNATETLITTTAQLDALFPKQEPKSKQVALSDNLLIAIVDDLNKRWTCDPLFDDVWTHAVANPSTYREPHILPSGEIIKGSWAPSSITVHVLYPNGQLKSYESYLFVEEEMERISSWRSRYNGNLRLRYGSVNVRIRKDGTIKTERFADTIFGEAIKLVRWAVESEAETFNKKHVKAVAAGYKIQTDYDSSWMFSVTPSKQLGKVDVHLPSLALDPDKARALVVALGQLGIIKESN
jgi:hypothetical protein